ncbi:MAG: GGDEF domain-containing protein [Clostridiaceae bacterium]|nr:GGDEF domain-containing protein [Clostridiaceae bacterium]
MFKLNSNKGIISVVPFLILLIAWILAMNTFVSKNELNVIFITMPYIFAFFAMVLSIWFQHSRVFYAVCVILFSIVILSSPGKLNQKAFKNGISILIPIVFIILAIVEERGITSKHGLIKGLVFIAMVLFVVIDSGNVSPWLEKLNPLEFALKDNGIIQGIPVISVFSFLICLFILLTRFFILSSNMDIAFTGATLGCIIILHFTRFPDILSLFSSAVFLIYIIALFEASYSFAFHDALTGLLSRRAMEHEFLRIGNRYTLAIIDIDYFKQVNDRFGHQVGDEVLRMVASCLQKYARGGKVFRYGGEEFVIIFPKKTIKETLRILERVRCGVQSRPFVIRSPNRPKKKPKEEKLHQGGSEMFRVTVSIGVAEKTEKMRNRTDTEIIEMADKAVYQAKANGRNCIVY